MMRFACFLFGGFKFFSRMAIGHACIAVDDNERIFSDLASAGVARVADLGVGALDRWFC